MLELRWIHTIFILVIFQMWHEHMNGKSLMNIGFKADIKPNIATTIALDWDNIFFLYIQTMVDLKIRLNKR